jgi:hypothetical protein
LRQSCYPYQNCKLMKIPSWPAWFPYPISWLKGFVLSYAFTSTVRDQFPLPPGLIVATGRTGLLLMSQSAKPQNLSLGMPVLTTWSNTKQPPWKEGLNAFIISFVASILVSFVVFTIVPPQQVRCVQEWQTMLDSLLFPDRNDGSFSLPLSIRSLGASATGGQARKAIAEFHRTRSKSNRTRTQPTER